MGVLTGKKALVTGGTRGIGRAIAIRLQTEGALVFVTGTTKKDNSPNNCHYLSIDFSDSVKTEKFIKELNNFDFDILINNAGINKISPYLEINPKDFDLIQKVNVRAPFLLCQAIIPNMKKKKWGRIVNVSSIFGKISKEFRASYSTSKFALDGMTTSLAIEVASEGILVNCIAPGFIDTDMTQKILGKKGMTDLASRVPAKRLGKPEEVAAFVAWLVGPENTYITGQNIAIDGGFTRV